MIITLKNADFSLSNIGTLSTWRITRSIGAGAVYAGPIHVDKNAALNATITISEGYELGAAGVSMTMGGVTNNSYTMNGNVITIAIAKVTGNVMIKVPTVNVSTGEEDEPIVPDVPGTVSTVDITDQFAWNTTGKMVYDTGVNTTESGWKTSDYVDISNYSDLTVVMPCSIYAQANGGYTFYDENKVFISGVKIPINTNNSAYTPETVEIEVPENAVYMRATWTDTLDIGLFNCVATTKGQQTPDIPSQPEPDVTDYIFEDVTAQVNFNSGYYINAATGAATPNGSWKHSPFGASTGINLTEYAGGKMRITIPVSLSMPANLGIAFYEKFSSEGTFIIDAGYTPDKLVMDDDTYETVVLDIPASAQCFRTTWYADKFASEFKCELAKPIGSNAPEEEPDVPSVDQPTGEEVDLTSLFEATWTEGARVLSNNGSTAGDTNWKYSDYIDVSPYKQLRLTINKAKATNSTTGPAFYDESKKYISGVAQIGSTTGQNSWEIRTIDVPANAKYVRTCWYSQNHTDWTVLDMADWAFSCIGIK